MPGKTTRKCAERETSGVVAPRKSVTRSLFSPLLPLIVVLCAFSLFTHADDKEGADHPSVNPIAISPGQSANAIINEPTISSRVLGGGAAAPGEWPSVVALVRANNFPLENRLFCGGTIVAERWIMTAAHCLFNAFDIQLAPTSLRVVSGITDLRNELPDEEHIVTNIIVHPDYQHATDRIIPFDIALLELATSLDQPAVELFAEDTERYTGSLGFIAGWGAVQFVPPNNFVFPTTLQDAVVPLISNAVCNDPQSYNGAISANQVCAGYAEGGIDSCSGDSGGPLFIVENGQQIQVGITGFGDGCASPLFYGIYTNVSHFIPWLSNYIQVPEQSAELIASRQAALLGQIASESTSSSRGFFGGSLHPIMILLLGLYPMGRCLARRLTEVAHHTHQRAVIPSVVGLSLASVLVSCASAGNSKGLDVSLASAEGRVGLRSERLGDHYDSVLARLQNYYPDMPECVSDVAVLQGTGRLSMQVLCTAIPESAEYVSGLRVQTVDYLFLDDQLVRIQVAMESESLSELTHMLNTRYTLPAPSPRPFEWRAEGPDSVKDHVRLRLLIEQPDTSEDGIRTASLQFIDGRLEKRMPSLFATD